MDVNEFVKELEVNLKKRQREFLRYNVEVSSFGNPPFLFRRE